MAIINGKIHYKWWFSIAMLDDQRLGLLIGDLWDKAWVKLGNDWSCIKCLPCLLLPELDVLVVVIMWATLLVSVAQSTEILNDLDLQVTRYFQEVLQLFFMGYEFSPRR